MLRTRVITALVLVGLLVAAALWSPLALISLCAAFLGMTLFEWLRLSGVPDAPAGLLSVLTAVGAVALEWIDARPAPVVLAGLCAPACLAWVGIGWLLARAQISGVTLSRFVLVGSAVALCAVAWFAMVALLRDGDLWTLSVLALVWLADIAAYFSGRAFGKRKLASRISPGKTWAGVWGAFAVVLGGTEAVRWIWPDSDLWSTVVLRAAPVAGPIVLAVFVAMSIVGDLFESLVKRQAGAKDSGRVLPGHGGVWDRIDACLPVLPLAVLTQWILTHGALNHGILTRSALGVGMNHG